MGCGPNCPCAGSCQPKASTNPADFADRFSEWNPLDICDDCDKGADQCICVQPGDRESLQNALSYVLGRDGVDLPSPKPAYTDEELTDAARGLGQWIRSREPLAEPDVEPGVFPVVGGHLTPEALDYEPPILSFEDVQALMHMVGQLTAIRTRLELMAEDDQDPAAEAADLIDIAVGRLGLVVEARFP